MKRIFLLFTIIALVWSCEKDDNELTYEEVVHRLEIEKAKVNQDSLNAIVEGEWFEAIGFSEFHTGLIFSPDTKNFKEIRINSTGNEECVLNVNDYFFVKVDPEPDAYRMVSFHNRFGEMNPDLYAFLKITKEAIFYASISLPPEAKNDVNLAYKYVMAEFKGSIDEEFGTKLQRKKQGL